MAVRRSFVLIGFLVAACAGTAPLMPVAPSSGPPSSAPPASADVAEVRREDLDQLVEQLDTIHPNPFLGEGEAAFRARVDAVAARADERSDAGFLVDVMGLMGHRDRDGHSGAWAMAQQGERVHVLPVWLREFPDGLRVVATRPPLADLVGGIVTGVGGTPVEGARRLVTPLVPADNDSNRRANLPMYLLVKEVVDELGIQQPGAAALSLQFDDGTTRDVEVEAVPIGAFRDWLFSVYPRYPTGLPPDDEGTRDRQRRDEAFWTETLPDGTLYVAYHEVRSRSGGTLTIGRLANDVRAAEGGVVVDLRSNPGGDNTTYQVFLRAVRDQGVKGPGRVALLTSRDTFSAAGNFVTELKVGEGGDDILLVGEPPGGGLDIYGDVATVTLKHSGIVVLISRRYHEKAPGDDRLQIEPDVPVEASWADAVAGRDTVLQAALDALAALRQEAAP
jgi:hypothetical protein